MPWNGHCETEFVAIPELAHLEWELAADNPIPFLFKLELNSPGIFLLELLVLMRAPSDFK
jgi:hypothetical protein